MGCVASHLPPAYLHSQPAEHRKLAANAYFFSFLDHTELGSKRSDHRKKSHSAGERGDRAQSRAPQISARSISVFVGFEDLLASLASLCCYLLNIVLHLHYLNRLLQSEHLHCHSEWKNLYHLPQIGNTHKNKPRLIKRKNGNPRQGLGGQRSGNTSQPTASGCQWPGHSVEDTKVSWNVRKAKNP